MSNKIHTLKVDLNWDLVQFISRIDRFDASWSTIEKKEGESLKQLKSVQTIKSVAASTRIEGSHLSNAEVDALLNNLDINSLQSRDEQEVVGYFDTLEQILESFEGIEISQNNLKGLHNMLLKHSSKDHWHKGNYKQLSNAVKVTAQTGASSIIFRPTEPGHPTEDAMQALVKWYQEDQLTHNLVKAAVFTYEFLSIHPFQDGNGRLSRLLSTLLLLKSGYKWIQYVSFENEIERRKKEYYQKLRECQLCRPGEDISSWVYFFLDALTTIQEKLQIKLERYGIESQLSPREKAVLAYIGENPGCKSGQISRQLKTPSATTKRILRKLLDLKLIHRHGIGPGTHYSSF